METTISHAPIFETYSRWEGVTEPGFHTDFLGVRTREYFFGGKTESGGRHRKASYPALDEEYFEWISILNAIERADRTFTVIELGAGYGRWIGRAAVAARQSRPELKTYLVGVEAEPSHFQWMRTFLKDNNLNPRNHWLIEAAVSDKPGWVNFHVGDPNAWYGQAIDPNQSVAETPPLWKRILRRLIRPAVPMNKKIEPTRAITLDSILTKLNKVDLIDADIQGSEAVVFEASAKLVNERVCAVHIGTHSEEVEERLRTLFTNLGWECQYDFSLSKTLDTPFGPVDFGDGVQAWTNPRL